MFTEENKKVIINFTNENLYILDISQIQQAERYINKLVQSKYFSEEMKKTAYEKAKLRRDRNKEKQPDRQFRSFFR